jgi:hypothetical protein
MSLFIFSAPRKRGCNEPAELLSLARANSSRSHSFFSWSKEKAHMGDTRERSVGVKLVEKNSIERQKRRGLLCRGVLRSLHQVSRGVLGSFVQCPLSFLSFFCSCSGPCHGAPCDSPAAQGLRQSDNGFRVAAWAHLCSARGQQPSCFFTWISRKDIAWSFTARCSA